MLRNTIFLYPLHRCQEIDPSQATTCVSEIDPFLSKTFVNSSSLEVLRLITHFTILTRAKLYFHPKHFQRGVYIMMPLLLYPSSPPHFFYPDALVKNSFPKTINLLSSLRLNFVPHIQIFHDFIPRYPELRTVRKLNIDFLFVFQVSYRLPGLRSFGKLLETRE